MQQNVNNESNWAKVTVGSDNWVMMEVELGQEKKKTVKVHNIITFLASTMRKKGDKTVSHRVYNTVNKLE